MASSDNRPGASGDTSRSGTTGSATSSASDTAQQAAQTVREQAGRAAEQTQQQAKAFLSKQKEVAADHIENVAQVLHQAVDQLRQRSPGAISDYAERAVGGIDSLASALRENDVRSLVGQVEDFARRQPALFVAGTVAAGFALARFLKSSSRDEGGYDQAASGRRYSQDGSRAPAYSGEAGTSARSTTSSLSQSAPAMGSSDGPSSPQYGTTRSARPGMQASAEEIQRAMSKEPK